MDVVINLNYLALCCVLLNLQQIMAEASREGSAEGFIELIMNFTAGLDVGLYGLASISIVLNALDTAPGKPSNS